MAQTYTRQSTFSDGDTITAALFNDEYNQLVNVFAYSSTDASSTGHRHDGTSGEGGNIPKIGDLDFLNKIEVDSTNNRWGFYVEVSSSAVEQIRIQDGAIVPVTDNDIDLGTSSLEFKDLYLDGTATIDTLTVNEAATVGTTLGVTGATTLSSTLAVTGTSTLTGNVTASNDVSVGGSLTVTGDATINGNLTFGNADTDSITIGAEIDSDLIPNTDGTYDLGSSTKEWQDLFIDGTANIDSLVADTADINAGTIDNTAIGGTTASSGAFTTITASSTLGVTGESTLASATVSDLTSGRVVLAGTSGAIEDSANLTFDGSTLAVTGATTVSTNLTVSGNTTLGNAATDTVTVTADFASNLIPSVDNTYDLGASGSEWKDLYVNGIAYVDAINFNGTAITATAAELNILDGVTSTTAELNILDGVTSTATELNIVDGDTAATATTLADADRVVVNDAGTMVQVALTDFETYFESALDTLSNVTTVGALNAGSITSGFGAIDNGSSAITTTGTITYGSLSDGTITITAFVDEDDMSSDSATLVPTQQSVKAYVDSQVTAQDLDFQGDSGGALSIDLDSETLTIAGGTGIDTTGATNTLTVAIDSTVATLTGSQTLTNKTLTTPVISSISNTGTLTLPTSTDTLVGRATTDTLTNKTLTSPVLNTGVSGTAVLDDDTFATASATTLATSESIKAYVDSQGASTLNALTDTNITTPADASLLFYDTGTSKWIDNVVSGDITIADTGVAAIEAGVIVNADINASAAIDVSKTALTAGTGLTLSTNTLSVDASQTQITAVGTIATGTWQGTAIADAYVANDLTISGGTVDNTVIGGTTPDKATFVGASAYDAGVVIKSGGSTTASWSRLNITNQNDTGGGVGIIYMDGSGSFAFRNDTGTNQIMSFIFGSAEEFRMTSSGNFHADGDVIAYSTTISDASLKDDVETIDRALDKVSNLRGVTYTWNAGSREGKRDLGVIAQEVEAVIPEIVHEHEMPLLDGETYKTVDYEKLTAVLIEAVKELKAELDALKAAQ